MYNEKNVKENKWLHLMKNHLITMLNLQKTIKNLKHEKLEEKMKTENQDENHVCCFEDDSLDGLSQRSAAQNSVIRIFCCQCGIFLMMVPHCVRRSTMNTCANPREPCKSLHAKATKTHRIQNDTGCH